MHSPRIQIVRAIENRILWRHQSALLINRCVHSKLGGLALAVTAEWNGTGDRKKTRIFGTCFVTGCFISMGRNGCRVIIRIEPAPSSSGQNMHKIWMTGLNPTNNKQRKDTQWQRVGLPGRISQLWLQNWHKAVQWQHVHSKEGPEAETSRKVSDCRTKRFQKVLIHGLKTIGFHVIYCAQCYDNVCYFKRNTNMLNVAIGLHMTGGTMPRKQISKTTIFVGYYYSYVPWHQRQIS